MLPYVSGFDISEPELGFDLPTMSEDDRKVIEEETEVVDEDTAAMPPPPEKAIEIEKMEEQKLKSKFPG